MCALLNNLSLCIYTVVLPYWKLLYHFCNLTSGHLINNKLTYILCVNMSIPWHVGESGSKSLQAILKNLTLSWHWILLIYNDPLTTGPIIFVFFYIFSLPHYISALKHIEIETWHQSARVLNLRPSFSQYCEEPPWPRCSVLGLRPPGLEFRILCLEDSVISIISPSSGGSPGPV